MCGNVMIQALATYLSHGNILSTQRKAWCTYWNKMQPVYSPCSVSIPPPQKKTCTKWYEQSNINSSRTIDQLL